MDRERIVQLFFFGFLALMAWELYTLLTPFLMPIAWAILLAFLAHPLLAQLHRHIKSRSLCAIIITVAVALGVVLPAVWLSGRLVAEAQKLYAEVGQGFTAKSLSDWASRSRVATIASERLANRFNIHDQASQWLITAAKFTSEYIAGHLAGVAKNVVGFVVDFGIVILTFFYLLRDGEDYYDSLRRLTPLHEDDKKQIFDTLSHTLSAVMRGLMLTALLQGVTIGLGLLIFGMPYWVFLALAAAAVGLLPIGGTALVWVPAAIYLFFAVGWGNSVGLLVWSLIWVAIIDNFLKPLAMRHGTGLPTMVLFFGIAGGLEAYGPIGIFAGPAIISVFVALLRVYRKTYGEVRKAA